MKAPLFILSSGIQNFLKPHLLTAAVGDRPVKFRNTLLAPTLFAASAMLLSRSAQAAAVTWSGNTDVLFNTGANWSTTAIPNTGDTLAFGVKGTSGAALTNDIPSLGVGGIIFNSGASAFTIGGNAVTLPGDGTGVITNSSTVAQTLNFNLSSTSVFTVATTAGGGDLALGGNISGVNGALAIQGGGVVTLSGSNSFTGGITVSGGVLRFAREAQLGAASGGVTLTGGTLSTANTFSSSGRTLATGSASAFDVATGFTTVWNGSVTGTAALAKTGGGTLSLNATGGNTFSGDITAALNGGTIKIGGNVYATGTAQTGFTLGSLTSSNTLTVVRGATFNIEDNATGSSAGYVADRLGSSGSRPAVKLAGGTFNYNGANNAAVMTQTLGALTLDSGMSTINVARNTSGTPELVFSSLTRNSGAFVNLTGTALGSGASDARILFTSTPTMVGGGGLALSTSMSIIPGARSGNDLATYDTYGVRPLATVEYNAVTGNDINGAGATDNVKISNATPIAFVGLSSGRTINSLVVTATANATWAMGNPLTITSGQFLSTPNNSLNISTGTLTAGSGSATDFVLTILQNTTTIGANINNNGSGAITLVKNGTGSLTLNNGTDNTFSGGTYLNEGIITSGATTNRRYLGTGPVTVGNAGQLKFASMGLTSYSGSRATPTYTVLTGGEVSLPNAAAQSNEFFNLASGAALSIAGTTVAGSLDLNTNLNAASGAILGETAVGVNAALKVGGVAIGTALTTPTYYFGLAGSLTENIAVGAGTPWLGLSTDRSSFTYQGSALTTTNTITANSDFTLQGMALPGTGVPTYAVLTLGNGSSPSVIPRILTPNGNVNANIVGSVTLNNDNSVYGSNGNTLTFQVTPGATLTAAALANVTGIGAGTAAVNVQSGGQLIIGTNTAAWGGPVTVQGGGYFKANQAGGLTGSGALTFNNGSIIDIVTSALGFSGAQAAAATINAGTIVRLDVGSFGAAGTTLDSFFSSKGPVIYEMFGGNNVAANPTSPGTTILTLNQDANGVGGILTNDATSRTVTAVANGLITIGNAKSGAMAASTNTTLTVPQAIALGSGTLNIGTSQSIDGNQKVGTVSLTAAAGVNTASAGAAVNVAAGTLTIGAANTLPNSLNLTLGAGATLTVSNAQTINGVLTSDSASTINGTSTLTLGVAGNYSLNSIIAGTVSVMGAGGGIFTVTNPSSVGTAGVTSGSLALGTNVTGAGMGLNATSAAGATTVIDLGANTVNASAVNLGGSGTTSVANIIGAGGTLNLLGNVTYTATNNPLASTIGVSTLVNSGGNRTLAVGHSASNANTDLTIASNIYLSETNATGRMLNTGGAGGIVITGTISDSAAGLSLTPATSGLYLNSTGTITLQAANLYSGTTQVIAQYGVGVANDAAFGSSTVYFGDSALSNGGFFSVGGARTIANAIFINRTLPVTGTNSIALTGAFTNQGYTINSNIPAASGSLTLSGTVALSETQATGRFLTIGGTGNTLISGAVVDSMAGPYAAPAGGLTITNTGTTTISGSNSYTGVTTLGTALSTVVLNNDYALGSGTLAFSANPTILSTSGSRTIGNWTTLNTGNGYSVTIGGTNAVTFSGIVANTAAGTAKLTNNDPAGLTLSGTIYPSRVTTGASAQALILDGSGPIVISGVIKDGLGVSSLTYSGSNTLTLSASNAFAGTVTVSSGTLLVGNAGAIPSTTTLTLGSASGGVLDMYGNNVTVNVMNAGNALGTVTDNAVGSGTGTFSVLANTTGFYIAPAFNDGANGRKLAVIVSSTNGGISDVRLSNANNTFSGGLTLTGTGNNQTRFVIAGYTFASSTNAQGALTASNFGTGPITIGTSPTDRAQVDIALASTTIYNDIVVNSALGTDYSGAFRVDTAGNVLAGKVTANMAPVKFSGAGSVNITGQVTGSSGVAVSGPSGPTVTLSNTSNNYTGGNSISLGTLSFVNGALPGSVTFSGGALQWAAGNTQDISSQGISVASGATGTLDLQSNSVVFASALSGSGNLAKIGAGTLTLAADNNLSASSTFTAAAGTVQLNTANALANPSVSVASAGGLAFNSGIDAFNLGGLSGSGGIVLTNTAGGTVSLSIGGNNTSPSVYSGNVTGSGTLTKVGTGTLTMSGTNTFSGGLYILNGTVVPNAPLGTGSAYAVYTALGGASGTSGTIYMGATSGSNNTALLLSNADFQQLANPIVVQAGNSGTATIGTGVSSPGSGMNLTVSSAITANNTLMLVNQATAGIGRTITFSGPITTASGSANLILNDSATNGSSPNVALTGFVNNAGTISNIGTSTVGNATISGTIGSAVTQIIQNSPTSSLTISGSNLFSGTVNVINGTLIAGANGTVLGNNGTAPVLLGDTATLATGATLGLSAAAYYDPITVVAGGLGTLTINEVGNYSTQASITLQKGLSFTGAGSSQATVAGGITGTGDITVNRTSSNPFTMSGTAINPNGNIFNIGTSALAISAPIGSHVTGLSQNGSGNVTLSGSNAYTGSTFLNAGTLTLGNAAALGTSTLAINGGTLDSNVSNLVLSTSNAVAVNADFTFKGTQNLTLGSGTVTLNGLRNLTVTANTLSFNGVVVDGSSAGGFTTYGSKTLSLNNSSNSFTGGLYNTGGTIQTTATTGTPFGTGNITLSATNNSGGVTPNLVFATAATSGISAYTILSGSGSQLSFGNTDYVYLNKGTSAGITVTAGSVSGTTPVFNRIGHGQFFFVGTSNNASDYGGVTKFLVSGSGAAVPTVTNGMVAPYFMGVTNGSNGLLCFMTYDPVMGFKNATYDMTLTGSSSLSGSGTTSKLMLNGVTITSSGTAYAVNNNTATTLNSGVTLNILGDGATAGLILAATIFPATSNAAINFGTAEGIISVTGNNPTISVPIQGTGGITKNQYNGTNGNLTLSGSNTYTGPTTIDFGTLTIGAGGVIASGSDSVVNIAPGATFANSGIVNAPVANVAGGTVTNNAGGYLVSVNSPVGATLTNSGTLGTLTGTNAGTLTNSGVINSAVTNYGTLTNSGTMGALTLGGTAAATSTTLNGGSTTGAVTVNSTSTLTLAGSTNLSIGTISGTGASATVSQNNTYSTGSGTVLTYADGSSFTSFNFGANSKTDLTNGGGTTYVTSFGRNLVATASVTLDGGTWNTAGLGQNYTNAQFGGTMGIVNGAVMNVTSSSFAGHGTYNIGGTGAGTLNLNTGWSVANPATNWGPVYNVQNGGTLISLSSITLSTGGANTAATTDSASVAAGGKIVIAGNLTVGGATAQGSGGSENNTLTVSGGKLSVNGVLSMAAPLTSVTNNFIWSGGQITASSITTANLPSATLSNTAGTLAPGDVFSTGLTTVTGAYTQGSGGTLAVDLGGATASSAFQDVGLGKYDQLSVTGTATLAGNLSINIAPGYTPGGNVHTVVKSGTGNTTMLVTSGTFANGTVIPTNEGFSTMTVAAVASTATTSGSLNLGSYAITNQWASGATTWGSSGTSSWTGTAAADPNSASAGALFGTTGTGGTVTLDQPRTVKNVTFNNATGYTLAASGSGALTLDNGSGQAVLSSVAGSHAINVPVTLNSDLIVGSGNGASLTLGGNIGGATKALTVAGAGAVTFSGSNSFASVTLSSGTTVVANNGAFGAAPIAFAGTTAVLASGTSAGNTLTNAVTLGSLAAGASGTVAGAGSLALNGVFTSAGGSNTLTNSIAPATGTLTLGGSVYLSDQAGIARTLTIAGVGNTNITGAISNYKSYSAVANALTIASTGTTSLAAANTYTGATTVNTGATLKLDAANAISGGGGVVNSGLLIVNNASALNGAGTINMANAAAVFNNNTGGTLTLSNVFGGGVNSSNPVIMGSDIVFTTMAATQSTTAFSGFAVNNNTTFAGGYQLIQTNDIFSRNVTFKGSGNVVISGNIINRNDLSTTYLGTLTYSGNGSLTLSGSANTFSGGVWLSSGTLDINSATALGSTVGSGTTYMSTAPGTFVINGPSTIDNTGASAVTIANSNPVTVNADFAFTGTKDLNLGTGALSLGTAAGTTRTITANAGTLTVGGSISNGTTANALIKAGAGTLALTGSNSYSGGTTITAGTLRIASDTALGSGGSLSFNGTGATLQLGADVTTARSYVLNSAGTIDTNGFTLAQNGAISGTGALVKIGDGTLALGGSNSYSGGTTVNNGTLQLGSVNALCSASSGLTMNGGTLDLNGIATAPVALSGGAGALITNMASGTGTLTTTISSGSSVFAGNITDGTGGVALTKEGAGKLILSGSLSMTGLNANNGVAELTQSGSIGALSVSGSGAVTLTAHTGGNPYKVIDTSSLSIAPGSGMDLWNNAMIVRASGTAQNATNLAAVQGQVNSAKNGLLWNGVGIGSTTAYNEAQPPLGTQALALMVYDNSVINQSSFEGVTGLGYFDGGGQPVGYNQVLVKLTYLGDFNADGVINASDYTWLDGFALSGNVLGDLNGDGFVNATDYTWLDGSALNQGFGVLADSRSGILPLPAPAASLGTGAAPASPEAVPEPGIFGLLVAGALGVLSRRSRKGKTE